VLKLYYVCVRYGAARILMSTGLSMRPANTNETTKTDMLTVKCHLQSLHNFHPRDVIIKVIKGGKM